MIKAPELTKRYGDTTAVHCLNVTIAPGTVTGFLGPNGAGKYTIMRMIMGLDRPTSGTVHGKPYPAEGGSPGRFISATDPPAPPTRSAHAGSARHAPSAATHPTAGPPAPPDAPR
jgi:ABC-type branched-subunit amino acid transport system ATPase component